MEYLKSAFGIAWVIATLAVTGLIGLMFTVVAGYTGLSQMATGIVLTLFVLYLIVSFCKGTTFLKWIVAPFKD